MSRSALVSILMVTMLALLAAAAACAPAAPAAPAATQPPATTPPATNPPTAPAPETATPPAAPEAGKPVADADLPFPPAYYTNDQLGFTVRYPNTWASAPFTWEYRVFYVKDPKGLPNFSVNIFPTTDIEKVKEIFTQYYKSNNATAIKIRDDGTLTLYDGTVANLLDAFYTYSGIEHDAYSMVLQRNGKIAVLTITGIQGMMDYDAAKTAFKGIILK